MYEGYVRYLRTKKKSEVTIKGYIDNLNIVTRALLKKEFKECSTEEFVAFDNLSYMQFVEKQQELGMRANTIKLRLNAWKSVVGYLNDVDVINMDEYSKRWFALNKWIKELKDRSSEKKEKNTLTKEEVLTLLSTVDRMGKNIYRRKLFLLLLVNNGLRISELTNIKLDDIDLENRTIKITGKGDQVENIRINQSIVDALDLYITKERVLCKNNTTNNKLFLTTHGTSLTPRHSDSEIKSICAKANISKDISCHRLRATSATMMYELTGDIYSVKNHLRHVSITTTQRYINKEGVSKEVVDFLI